MSQLELKVRNSSTMAGTTFSAKIQNTFPYHLFGRLGCTHAFCRTAQMRQRPSFPFRIHPWNTIRNRHTGKYLTLANDELGVHRWGLEPTQRWLSSQVHVANGRGKKDWKMAFLWRGPWLVTCATDNKNPLLLYFSGTCEWFGFRSFQYKEQVLRSGFFFSNILNIQRKEI